MLKTILNDYSIGTKNTLVGIVLNGDYPRTVSHLNSYTDKKRLYQFIDSIQNRGEGYDIDSSLTQARMLFEKGRKDAAKTLVIFRTHEAATDPAVKQRLEQLGYKIVVVGLGEDINPTELVDLAGDKGDVATSANEKDDEDVSKRIIDSLLPGKVLGIY